MLWSPALPPWFSKKSSPRLPATRMPSRDRLRPTIRRKRRRTRSEVRPKSVPCFALPLRPTMARDVTSSSPRPTPESAASTAEYLEYELARTRAALDKTDDHLRATLRTLEEVGASLVERERYIDSLPSVRVKKWIVSRHPNRGS